MIFKKSRTKIIALIMGVLIAVLAATVAIIFYSSISDVSRQNLDMLELYAESYAKNGMPGQEESDDSQENRRLHLSTFYSILFSKSGDALEINNDPRSNFSDEELMLFAAGLLENEESYGTAQSIAYLVTHEQSYTLVTMMDNMVIGESFETLLRYTLIFGGIAILGLFILSIFLANWIIQPLEEAYQKQRQFISDAGHELKTPISTINANAEMLLRTVGENQWLSNIQYENRRMSIMVRQLLDLARMENEQVAMEELELSRVVLSAVLPFEAKAFEQDITLSYSVQDSIKINGNREQMGKLVSILIDNAFQHSAPRGTITVSLNASRGFAELSVSNIGEEIPPDQRERIFERFYRTDKARNSDSNNYGLGLAIAKAIVTAHNGRISVSCKDGITVFSAVFPH